MRVKLISNSVLAHFGSRICRPRRLSQLEVKDVVYPLGPLLPIPPQVPLRYAVFHREPLNSLRYIQFSDLETIHFPSLRLESHFFRRGCPLQHFMPSVLLQLKKGE